MFGCLPLNAFWLLLCWLLVGWIGCLLCDWLLDWCWLVCGGVSRILGCLIAADGV